MPCPRSRPGLVVGLADRLDTLAGLFAAGLAPTGNKDPFAQRRAALGLVQNLIAWDLDFDLRHGPAGCRRPTCPSRPAPRRQAACLDFIIERLRNVLLEAGLALRCGRCCPGCAGRQPGRRARALSQQLSAWVARPDWHTILPAYARCVRITRSFEQALPGRPAGFAEPPKADLYAALLAGRGARDTAPARWMTSCSAFLPMIPVINRFFEQVLVMAEDEALQRNRLGLLQRIAALASGVADLSRLEGF